ncbi:MAG TPA: permease [Candidatus Omnitrophota bacterium]|nr:permease [Candidatus Omnitrophota bacterium]HSA30764.1 permease [Candidatus Omnitrophota bacterium]
MARDPICGMAVDEKKGLRLAHGGQTFFFCSAHCLEKFAKERGVCASEIASCARPSRAPFYRNKVFMAAAVLLAVSLLSLAVPVLEPFRMVLMMYVQKLWWAVLLGILIGGLIDHYIPREYISFFLSQPKKTTIFSAVMLGFFMSACSHGILALAIQLHKKGASTPAVVAFLLASPWANISLTFMLVSFFGLKAFYIIGGAVVIAITTGLIFLVLDERGLIEHNTNSLEIQAGFSVRKDIQRRLKGYQFSRQNLWLDIKGVCQGMAALSNMVLWWILIGVGLASAAGAYVPPHFFDAYMGPTLAGLCVTLLAATVIEVCSEGSSPMAFEIFRQTGALGNSFVFLMAGVATDYTEIGLLWHNVGRRTAIWLPLITVPQVVVLGILANMIF